MGPISFDCIALKCTECIASVVGLVWVAIHCGVVQYCKCCKYCNVQTSVLECIASVVGLVWAPNVVLFNVQSVVGLSWIAIYCNVECCWVGLAVATCAMYAESVGLKFIVVLCNV